MKKFVFGFVIILILVASQLASPVQAQTTDEPTPPPRVVLTYASDDDTVVPFNLLGYTEDVLHGPYDTATYRFSLPADWFAYKDAEVRLAFKVFTVGISGTQTAPQEFIDGTIEAYFNGELLDTILLDTSGDRIVAITIPLASIEAVKEGSDHEFLLVLDAGSVCDEYDTSTRVAIHPYSQFRFPHIITEPSTNLALLPRPIYQNTFVEDKALLVVPDKPVQAEIEAALVVASGFGSMTSGKLDLSLVTASQLSSDQLENNHLIFVGKPDSLPLLTSVELPVPVRSGSFRGQEVQPEDGILQMAVSPWNPAKVVLIVGGNDDLGVAKAAAAVSTGQILVGTEENVSYVAEVLPEAQVVKLKIDLSFSDLGYEDRKLWQVGYNATEYRFYIPPGLELADDAYVDLIMSHSKLINYAVSGVVVQVNGKDIGSVRMSDETADYSQLRMNIPATTVVPGYNKLRINANLFPIDVCIDPRLASTWLRIWPESTLHLPTSIRLSTLTSSFDLGGYHNPFNLDPLLNTTAIVVPANNSTAWETAARIAFDLGNQADPPVSHLAAYFADALPENISAERHLLIIGLPVELPLLLDFNELLPAPFSPDSNSLSKNVLQVDYRIPSGTSIGYLQLINSPWNEANVLIGVFGSNNGGLQMAGDALTVPELRAGLAGDFALIINNQVLSADTRDKPIDESESQKTALDEFAFDTGKEIQGQPTWIVPAIGVVLVVMLLIIIVAVLTWFRQRRHG